MANIPIVHATTKVDYTGSGAIASNQELIAQDWNQTHVTLSAGAGLQIASDGGNPPTITFSIGGAAGTTSFGDSLIPSVDNLFDIGQVTPTLLRWKNLFLAGTASVGQTFIRTPNGGATAETFFNITDNIVYGNIKHGGVLGGHTNDLLISTPGTMIFQSTFDTATGVFRFYDPTGNNLLTINAGIQDNPAVMGLEPIPTNTWDLGNTTVNHVWRSAYFGTNVNLWDGTLIRSIFALAISAGTGFQTNSNNPLTMQGGASMSFSGNALTLTGPTGNNFTITGNANLFFTSVTGSLLVGTGNNFLPQTNNSSDMGSSTQAWKNYYGAGTVSAGGGFQTNSNTPLLMGASGVGENYQFRLSGTTFLFERAGVAAIAQYVPTTNIFSFPGSVIVSAGSGFQTNAANVLIVGNGAGFTQDGTTWQFKSVADPTRILKFDQFQLYAAPSATINLGVAGGLFNNGLFAGTMSAGGGFQTNAAFSLTANAIDILSSATAMVLETIPGFDILFRPGNTGAAGGSIRPFVSDDNLKDVGASNARWRSGYFAGTLSAGTIQFAASAVAGNLLPSKDATYSIGSNTLRWNNLNLTGATTDTGVYFYDGSQNETGHFGKDSSFGNRFAIGSSRSDQLTIFTPDGSNVKTERVRFQNGAAGSSPILFFETVSAGGGFQTNAAVSLNAGATWTIKASGNTLGFDGSSFFPGTDANRNLGTASNRWSSIFFQAAASFGGAFAAGSGFVTNTSAGIQLGGAAVGGIRTANTAAEIIPIVINGVTRYIQTFQIP